MMSKRTVERPDARLIVFDKDGQTVADIPMVVRPIVSDDERAVVLSIEMPQPQGGVIVEPDWVGKEITLEVSPAAVTRDRLTAEIIEAARRFEVSVG